MHRCLCFSSLSPFPKTGLREMHNNNNKKNKTKLLTPEVRDLPPPVARHHDRQLARQVRRVGEEPAPLVERLEDELQLPEVELREGALEVAHPAVDELGGARAGPGGEVVALDQGDGEAARRRVERDAGARRAAADDEDVELGGRGGLRLLLFGPGFEGVEGVLSRGEPVGEGDAGDLGSGEREEEEEEKVEVEKKRSTRARAFVFRSSRRAQKSKPRVSPASRPLSSFSSPVRLHWTRRGRAGREREREKTKRETQESRKRKRAESARRWTTTSLARSLARSLSSPPASPTGKKRDSLPGWARHRANPRRPERSPRRRPGPPWRARCGGQKRREPSRRVFFFLLLRQAREGEKKMKASRWAAEKSKMKLEKPFFFCLSGSNKRRPFFTQPLLSSRTKFIFSLSLITRKGREKGFKKTWTLE